MANQPSKPVNTPKPTTPKPTGQPTSPAKPKGK